MIKYYIESKPEDYTICYDIDSSSVSVSMDFE
jgi:hypothetical protein